jgi:hypothetical protein
MMTNDPYKNPPIIPEAHIQTSPEDEICDMCVFLNIPATIPAFTEYYYVCYGEPKPTQNYCKEHFATLQQSCQIDVID